MEYLVHTEQCRNIIRMGPEAFLQLCQRIRGIGLVKDAYRSTVEEQVAKFLHIIGQNVKNRRAIDGTHVRVKVSRVDAPHFRGRKDWPTQNIFAACDFNMKFTYVLAGWEGIASDSRILKGALVRDDPLVILEGKYYLGDACFMLKPNIITPYCGVRYHLKEYSRRGPKNAKELFNLRHHHLEMVDNDESLIEEVDHELLEEDVQPTPSHAHEHDYRVGCHIRDTIANKMWEDYVNN
ncbi:uncharacterized protein [Phaseolus vulgaris]|uniref:uncharacterized protein n=1 Tax=Phaseolus vulgaris TaxID=3885 RepID=UPI0035CBDDB7